MNLRHFDAADHPGERRAALFRRVMQEWFSIPLAIRSDHQDPLGVRIQGFDCGAVGVATLRFSAHAIEQAGQRRNSTRLLLSFQKQGCSRIMQDGRECQVRAGDFFLLDPARPFYVETDQIECHSLYLPRASVQAVIPDVHAFTARTLTTRRGAGTILGTLVDQLVESAGLMDGQAYQFITDAIPSLLASVVASSDPSERQLLARHKLAHLHRIRRFVNDHLADPELTPEMIAGRLNISIRYLHGLWQGESQTLMRMVTAKRLHRCAEDLANPALAGRSIGEIAASWGFAESSQFSRRFRQTFERSPRAYRRQCH